MATGFLSPISLNAQILSDQGIVGSGFQLFLYLAGTSTPATTYTSSSLSVPNSNPIVMAANGRWQNVSIWTPAGVVLKQVWVDANNNVIPGLTIDNIPALNDLTTVGTGGAIANFYGGADSGAANAYVLTFTSPFFTGLQNGNQITWLPGHTNTGASTMNVNGLGVLPITNLDGSALTAGEVVTGQPATIQYQSGNWVLLTGYTNLTAKGNVTLGSGGNIVLGGAGGTLTAYGQTAATQIDISPDTGSFTATVAGPWASPLTMTMQFRKSGKFVWLYSTTQALGSATNTGIVITMTGLPAEIQPALTAGGTWSAPCGTVQNLGANLLGIATVTAGSTSIVINWLGTVAGTNPVGLSNGYTFTSGGTAAVGPFAFQYPLA